MLLAHSSGTPNLDVKTIATYTLGDLLLYANAPQRITKAFKTIETNAGEAQIMMLTTGIATKGACRSH